LGRDPEIRNTSGGDRVANFSVATSEKWKDKEGTVQERTEWHKIVVWGRLVDVIEKYCRKGSKVYVSGQIRTRKYTDKEGAERYSTEIVLQGFNSELILLSDRDASSPPAAAGGGGERSETRPSERSATRQPASAGQVGGGWIDDDIPF
jgi:single-strand DNA-binding protein